MSKGRYVSKVDRNEAKSKSQYVSIRRSELEELVKQLAQLRRELETRLKT